MFYSRKDVHKLVYNRAITLMMNNGYQVMGSNIPCLTLLFQHNEESERMNIVGLINNIGKSELSPEQLDNISFQIERKFLIGQYAREINILYLVFTNDFEGAKKYSQGKSKFWLMDLLGEQIVVFEEQPEDFFGLQNILQNVFEEPNINNRKYFNERDNAAGNPGRRKKWPLVTLLLILINVIVYIWLEMNGDTENPIYMLQKGAAFSTYIFERHEYYRLFTAMFMHFGLSHLLNNMLALWIMGSKLEIILGNVRFFILYILSGLVGSIVSAFHYYHANHLAVSAGASGAIYGVLGAILVVAIIQRHRNDKSIFVRMGFVFLLMFNSNGTQSIDNYAHLGGLIGGIIIMFLFKKFSDKHKFGKLKN